VSSLPESTDEQFILYCECHAESDRALFHIDQVRRLYRLAGRPLDPNLRLPTFIALYARDNQELFRDAWKGLRRRERSKKSRGHLRLVPKEE
jgi:hypothetical protein